MKSKKTITLITIIFLLVASIGTVFAAVATGTITLPSTVTKPESISDAVYESEDMRIEPAKEQKVIMVDAQDKKLMFESSRQIITSEKDNEINKSNFSKGEIKQLLEEGYNVKDILQADQVCNETHEKPSTLLKRKKSENLDWSSIANKVKKERRTKAINNLKAKYPDIDKKLTDKKLSEDEKYELLAFMDNNDVSSVDAIVQEYKKGGQAKLAKFIKPKKEKLNKEEK